MPLDGIETVVRHLPDSDFSRGKLPDKMAGQSTFHRQEISEIGAPMALGNLSPRGRSSIGVAAAIFGLGINHWTFTKEGRGSLTLLIVCPLFLPYLIGGIIEPQIYRALGSGPARVEARYRWIAMGLIALGAVLAAWMAMDLYHVRF